MNEFRLHLEPEVNTAINEPDIALALQHHREINSYDDQWAALEISQFAHGRAVRLDIGPIYHGFKEATICTRYYSIIDGRGSFITVGHL
jgi:hypothetical protein